MPITPYVVGQWVREERFYGREGLIEEILSGHRNCLWILGTRRIGKTSILKQLEHLASTDPDSRYFPLFWDLQGCEAVEDLHDGFRDALLDAYDRLVDLEIELDAVDHQDLFVSLDRLRRVLRPHGLSVLLLGDEAEELVSIHETAPQFLRRLRRALQSSEDIRTVLASTIRLWNLAADRSVTSAFLNGFTPPIPVGNLGNDAARELVRQSQLPADAQPQVDAQTVEVIRSLSDNHPFLLQILGERFQAIGDLDAAIEEIATDEMVSFFFAADLGMLSALERRILRTISEQRGLTTAVIGERLALESTSLQGGLHRLHHLGLLHRGAAGEYSLKNYFFERWLTEAAEEEEDPTLAGHQAPTVRRPTDSEPASLRQLDGRYELLGRVGLGSSGEVHKARDALLDTVVALKILKREHCLDSEAIARLKREVVLARDVSHPNLLKIYHLGETDGRSYITMQFVDGPNLADLLAGGARFEPDHAVAIARKLADGLGGLHRNGVLHRDLKPSNILMGSNDEPLITDFGLARLKSGPSVTRSGVFLGTPAYASPEQARGAELDERSDLYALGVMLFEMVTGRLPFVSDSIRELLTMRIRDPAPLAHAVCPTAPVVLSELISTCLAREPSKRPTSAEELGRALARLS